MIVIWLLGLTVLLLISKWPVFGLYLILLLTPLNQLQQLDIPLFSSVIRIIGLITLAAFLAHYFLRKDTFTKTELLVPLVVFLFAYVVGLSRASDLRYGLQQVIALTMYFILYLLVVNSVKDQTTVKRMFLVLMIAVSGLALFGIVQYFRGETLFPPELGRFGAFRMEDQSIIRVIGVFRNPNAFAYNYLLAIPLMMGILLVEKRRVHQLIIMVLLAVCFFCLFLTYSRSAFLALWVSMFIILYFIKWHHRVRTIIVFSAIFILLYVFLPEIFNILKFRMTFNIQDIGFQERIALIKGCIYTFLTYPLIGAGTGEAPIILGKYMHQSPVGPHNNLLLVLVETGLLGFIPFILIFANFTKKMVNSINETINRNSRIILISVLASIWGYFVNGLFHISINYALWWMILGLGMAQANLAKNK